MLKIVTNCRVCNSTDLTKYLDLGQLPLSNTLSNTSQEAINATRYNLQVLFCNNCGLSQLSIVIDPEVLFNNYVYRSSISESFKYHCAQLADELKTKYKFGPDSFHIDIAGNDGALIEEFRKVIGCKSLNVDPAYNMVKINDEKDIRIYSTFWGVKAARHIRETAWPKANLITATNVFAHVDNVRDFLFACDIVLAEDGVIVLEFPYIVDFIKNGEFDTIYFEHLSYFGLNPLMEICNSLGLAIFNAKKIDIHGGSLRVEIGRTGKFNNGAIEELMLSERQYLNIKPYLEFQKNVEYSVANIRNFLYDYKGKMAAFAASAKGNVLLNSVGELSSVIEYIVDQTPEKIGKFSPGTGIPIVDMDHLIKNPPRYLIILSWNFAKEIMTKCRQAGYKGKFVIPIPRLKIIS